MAVKTERDGGTGVVSGSGKGLGTSCVNFLKTEAFLRESSCVIQLVP